MRILNVEACNNPKSRNLSEKRLKSSIRQSIPSIFYKTDNNYTNLQNNPRPDRHMDSHHTQRNKKTNHIAPVAPDLPVASVGWFMTRVFTTSAGVPRVADTSPEATLPGGGAG